MRTVVAASITAAALALFIFLFMLINVDVINKKKLSDADKSIANYSHQIENIPNINKILTVQNQLQSVSSLHQNKHLTSRLFQYLPQVTPSNVCLGQVTLDTANTSLQVQGNTDSLKSINVYIDTLKFTTFKQNGQDSSKSAFPTVVESSFGLSSSNATGSAGTQCAGKPAPANFQLTITYDTTLFSNAQSVALNVPVGQYTTRSVLDDPSNPLFNGQTDKNSNTQNGSKTGSSTGGQ